jgi:hypothetical protein
MNLFDMFLLDDGIIDRFTDEDYEDMDPHMPILPDRYFSSTSRRNYRTKTRSNSDAEIEDWE